MAHTLENISCTPYLMLVSDGIPACSARQCHKPPQYAKARFDYHTKDLSRRSAHLTTYTRSYKPLFLIRFFCFDYEN